MSHVKSTAGLATILGLACVLSLAGYAQDLIPPLIINHWTFVPVPAGDATEGGAAVGDEGKIVTYTNSATDKDTEFEDNNAVVKGVRGDAEVELFEVAFNSGQRLSGNVSGGNLSDGIIKRTFQVKLRLLPKEKQQDVATDWFDSGDKRGVGDGRWDNTMAPANNPQPLRFRFGRAVTINGVKGEVTGKVTRAATGEPVSGATIGIVSDDPDYSGSPVSTTTSASGDYFVDGVYPGNITITISLFASQRVESDTLSPRGVVVHNVAM